MNTVNYDKFDAYIDGELSRAEREAFDSAMRENPGLREAMADYKKAREALGILVYRDVKERITRRPAVRSMVRTRRIIWGAVAASVLVGGCFGYSNIAYNDEALALGRLQPRTVVVERDLTRSDGVPEMVRAALESFEQGDYNNAVELVESLPSGQTDMPYAFIGHAYMRLGQPEKAISFFRNMLSQTNDLEREYFEWLLVLAYVQNSDDDRAISVIDDRIHDPSHDYYEEAQKLKDKLTSVWRKLVIE